MRRKTKKSKKKYFIAAAIVLGFALVGGVAYKSYLHITFSKRAAIELNVKDESINGMAASSGGTFTTADYSPEDGNTIALNIHLADGVTLSDPAALDKKYAGDTGKELVKQTKAIIGDDMRRSFVGKAVLELKFIDHDGATAYLYRVDIK
ncbi:hypothetical protein ACI1UM_10620 [Lactococcus petauri]|uniref:hypothetical protein n=1 Tax=Lactococcus petauri TaxID=1940789 RepID=UPI003852EE4A